MILTLSENGGGRSGALKETHNWGRKCLHEPKTHSPIDNLYAFPLGVFLQRPSTVYCDIGNTMIMVIDIITTAAQL